MTERQAQLVDAGRNVARRLPGKWGRRLRETGKFVVDYKGARAVGLRGWRFARAGRYSDTIVAPFGDGRIVVEAADDEIGRVVYMYGGYEREYMAAAVGFLADNNRPVDGRTFVDIGANIGTSTLDALLHFGFARSVSFEPDRDNYRLLRTNLVLNGLEERSATYLMAMSDREGTVTIERRAGNTGDSRVSVGGAAGDADADTVPCSRFDTLVAAGTLDVDAIGLLWIDVQGHDAFVLAGAESALAAGVPTMVEYWPDELAGAGGLDLFETLVREHYREVIDVRALERGRDGSARLPASRVGELRSRYPGERLTDLLLIR